MSEPEGATSSGASSGELAAGNTLAAAVAQPAGLPLFDERYRWVLLHALRWLRDVPGVDLDDPEQMEAAYGFLSAFVQEYVSGRGLVARLDPMRVAAVAESAAARSTVENILIDWLSSK